MQQPVVVEYEKLARRHHQRTGRRIRQGFMKYGDLKCARRSHGHNLTLGLYLIGAGISTWRPRTRVGLYLGTWNPR